MIRNNLFYKLLALGIAVSLWGYVNGERNPQARKSFSVQIEPRHAAQGYVTELSSSHATIVIQGPKTTVDGIRVGDASAWVDMRSFGSGRDKISASAKVSAAVAGVSKGEAEITVEPRSVRAKMEAIRAKQLPVEVKLLAAPPVGYAFTKPEVIPGTLEVSGKVTDLAAVRSLVLRVSHELTSKIDTHPVDSLVGVDPVDARGKSVPSVELSRHKVRLKMGVVSVPTTKSVLVSETITGRPRYPAKVTKVSVTPAFVTLQGRSQVLAGISTVETDEVSIEGLHDTFTREVALRLPPGVSAVNARRVSVTVIISDGE